MIRLLAVVAALLLAAPAIAQPARCRPAPTRRTRWWSTPRRAASSSSCATTSRRGTRPAQAARARGLLQRRAVPSGDRRLHGADRRRANGNGTGGSKYPDLRPSSPTCLTSAVWSAWRARATATKRQQPVVHHVRRRIEPERTVHRHRRSALRHGRGRQDQEGRTGAESRQDGEGAGRGRRKMRRAAAAVPLAALAVPARSRRGTRAGHDPDHRDQPLQCAATCADGVDQYVAGSDGGICWLLGAAPGRHLARAG